MPSFRAIALATTLLAAAATAVAPRATLAQTPVPAPASQYGPHLWDAPLYSRHFTKARGPNNSRSRKNPLTSCSPSPARAPSQTPSRSLR